MDAYQALAYRDVEDALSKRLDHSSDIWRRTTVNGDLEARDGRLEEGPMLRFERRYGHSLERVWRALTDPGELRNWFPSDEPMQVTESDPPRLLAATWYGDTLRFELQPDGDGCVLTFTHAFAERDTAARSAAGWHRSLARLEALLEGQPMSEAASLEAWPEVHERYAASFGVDPEIGRKAYAEHPLT